MNFDEVKGRLTGDGELESSSVLEDACFLLGLAEARGRLIDAMEADKARVLREHEQKVREAMEALQRIRADLQEFRAQCERLVKATEEQKVALERALAEKRELGVRATRAEATLEGVKSALHGSRP
jgi:chromosome segregation ATPase